MYLLFLFRILLTLSSTSLLIVIYLIKSDIKFFEINETYSYFLTYGIYFTVVVIISLLSLWLTNFLEGSSLKSQNDNRINNIKEIELANHTFLPTYLGYFFVSLSITTGDWITFGVIYAMVFLFTFYSQTNYFNPLFILLGYQFYYVTTVNNVKLFMITKKLMKDPSVYEFTNLKRINDFTFIDKGE